MIRGIPCGQRGIRTCAGKDRILIGWVQAFRRGLTVAPLAGSRPAAIFSTTALPRVGLIFAAYLVPLPNTVSLAIDTLQSRLRPIGSPSMVDQYRSSVRAADYRETVARGDQPAPPLGKSSVQQSVWMHDGEVPPPSSLPFPRSTAPRNLPVNPGASVPVPLSAGPRTLLQPAPVSQNDYAPLNQPRLSNQFATLDNSCHVSGPSTYTAASASGCCSPVNYQAPPASIAPPAPVFAPGVIGAPAPAFAPAAPFAPSVPIAAAPAGVPTRSLISFGQERYQVQVGPGLFGQPVAYVPGQKFRNWIRYIFP